VGLGGAYAFPLVICQLDLKSAHLLCLMKWFYLSLFLAQAIAAFAGSPLPTTARVASAFLPNASNACTKAFRVTSTGKARRRDSVIVRNGKIADFATYGYRDLEARAPMTLIPSFAFIPCPSDNQRRCASFLRRVGLS